MDTTTQSTLELLVGLVGAVLVVQTILILAILIVVWKWSRRIENTFEKLSQSVEPLLHVSRDLLAEGREKLASLSANLVEISQVAKTQMHRLDGLIKDTTERAQIQVARLDQLVSGTMNRVEETTHIIQRGVLTPIKEISGVTAGVRATVEYLFNRNRKTVEHATQDEELFI